nr:PREDICTED: breast carcinoma-amplified sequence 1 isoform X2 [Lepisosteus oculatus]
MGNESSSPETAVENGTDSQAEPIPQKLQNGGIVGQPLTISLNGTGDVDCEAAVQQNSALPSSLDTKERSSRSGKEGDKTRKDAKIMLPAAKSSFSLSFSQPVPVCAEATGATDSSPQPPSGTVPAVHQTVSLKPTPPQQSAAQAEDGKLGQDLPPRDPPPREATGQENGESKTGFFDKLFKQSDKEKAKVNEKPKQPLAASESKSASAPQSSPKEVQLTNGLKTEPGNVKKTETALQDPEGKSVNTPISTNVTVDSTLKDETIAVESTKEGAAREDQPQKIMNFFKTFATPSKTPKAEPESPGVSKEKKKACEVPEGKTNTEKEQKMLKMEKTSGVQSTPPTTVKTEAQGDTSKSKEQDSSTKQKTEKDSSPSPFSMLFRQKSSVKEIPQTKPNGVQEVDAASPVKAAKATTPAEAPKVDSKGDSATKGQKAAQKEGPKEPTAEPVAAEKQKPVKETSSPFSKLFRPKTIEEESPAGDQKKVEVDISKTPETPTQPELSANEEAEKKSSKSNFISFFKQKSPKEEESETDSAEVNDKVSDPTKEKSSTAPVEIQATSQETKEEAKPVPEAEKKKSRKPETTPKSKTLEVPQEKRSVSEGSQNGDDSAREPTKKVEKRNSIGMFFKGLGPKRLSDAGVQTDPVTILNPSEKSK